MMSLALVLLALVSCLVVTSATSPQLPASSSASARPDQSSSSSSPPLPPVITRVSGCADNLRNNVTYQCRPSDVITVSGQFFGVTVGQVLVGSELSACTISVQTSDSVTCQLSDSFPWNYYSGQLLPVVLVNVASQLGTRFYGLALAPRSSSTGLPVQSSSSSSSSVSPIITTVNGCTDVGTGTVHCQPGWIITVLGTNFQSINQVYLAPLSGVTILCSIIESWPGAVTCQLPQLSTIDYGEWIQAIVFDHQLLQWSPWFQDAVAMDPPDSSSSTGLPVQPSSSSSSSYPDTTVISSVSGCEDQGDTTINCAPGADLYVYFTYWSNSITTVIIADGFDCGNIRSGALQRYIQCSLPQHIDTSYEGWMLTVQAFDAYYGWSNKFQGLEIAPQPPSLSSSTGSAPTVPALVSISGCAGSMDNCTVGDAITLIGSGFSNNPVTPTAVELQVPHYTNPVTQYYCQSVGVYDDGELQCILPAIDSQLYSQLFYVRIVNGNGFSSPWLPALTYDGHATDDSDDLRTLLATAKSQMQQFSLATWILTGAVASVVLLVIVMLLRRCCCSSGPSKAATAGMSITANSPLIAAPPVATSMLASPPPPMSYYPVVCVE